MFSKEEKTFSGNLSPEAIYQSSGSSFLDFFVKLASWCFEPNHPQRLPRKVNNPLEPLHRSADLFGLSVSASKSVRLVSACLCFCLFASFTRCVGLRFVSLCLFFCLFASFTRSISLLFVYLVDVICCTGDFEKSLFSVCHNLSSVCRCLFDSQL